jgi:hypothetical protein
MLDDSIPRSIGVYGCSEWLVLSQAVPFFVIRHWIQILAVQVYGERRLSTIQLKQLRVLVREYPDLLKYCCIKPNQNQHPQQQLLLNMLCHDLSTDQELRPMRTKQILRLVAIDSSCLLLQDQLGQGPLDLMINDSVLNDPTCFYLWKHIIKSNPSVMDVQDTWNHNSILHTLLLRCHPTLKMVQLLVEANPDLVVLQNRLGSTPVHIACARTISMDMIDGHD